jgi:hypothetical protein
MPEAYQMNHVASLTPNDVAPWWRDTVPEGVRRIWTVGDEQIYRTCDIADPDWSLRTRLRPEDADGTADYIVSEFVPASPAEGPESSGRSAGQRQSEELRGAEPYDPL